VCPILEQWQNRFDPSSAVQSSPNSNSGPDVPIGALLGGCTGSSTVVAMMQKTTTRPIKTFKIRFESAMYDEFSYQAAVAQHLNTDHTQLLISDAPL
jgi:asparagine synthase (glutamine-hydrolysing)